MRRSCLVIAIVACGGPTTTQAPHPPVRDPQPFVVEPATSSPPPAPPVPRRSIITIVSASIDAERNAAVAWDDVKRKPAGKASPRSGPLAAYLAQHPEVAGSVVGALAPLDGDAPVTRRAAESAAADPMVVVEAGGRVFRSAVRPGESEPVWNFRFVVDLTDADHVHVTVVDWDEWSAYDVIGDVVLSGRELTAGAVVAVPRSGRFGRLTVSVAAAPAAEPVRHRVSVAGKSTWSETGISLIAGQRVAIIAAGEVCTRSDPAGCAGPEGQPTNLSPYNVAGFEKVGHGQLIAAIGDTRFAVGRELKLIAPSSGPLLLGINDRDAGNNRGELEVAVVVD